jgi:hypothetical protein
VTWAQALAPLLPAACGVALRLAGDRSVAMYGRTVKPLAV